MILGCESLGQGQEEQEDAAGPPEELLADPLQQQERQEVEDLQLQTATSKVCRWLHNHDGAPDAAQRESLGAPRHRRAAAGIIVE